MFLPSELAMDGQRGDPAKPMDIQNDAALVETSEHGPNGNNLGTDLPSEWYDPNYQVVWQPKRVRTGYLPPLTPVAPSIRAPFPQEPLSASAQSLSSSAAASFTGEAHRANSSSSSVGSTEPLSRGKVMLLYN